VLDFIRKSYENFLHFQTKIELFILPGEPEKKEVNTLLYRDTGHGADEDPEYFINWIGLTSGYSVANNSVLIR